MHFLARALHTAYNLNLYVPISKVNENFDRAHEVDAARRGKFWFRTNIFDEGEPVLEELTVDEILFGYQNFPGVFNYVEEMMKVEMKENDEGRRILESIGNFFREIATGKRLTLAQWIRRYIDGHPDYKHNSILSKKTMDELLLRLYEISKGEKEDANFRPIFDV